SQSGPWQSDPLCRNRIAYALLQLGERKDAVRRTKENLELEPLNAFARSILWTAKSETGEQTLEELIKNNPNTLVELATEYSGLRGQDWGPTCRLFETFSSKAPEAAQPLASLWAAQVFLRCGRAEPAARFENAFLNSS